MDNQLVETKGVVQRLILVIMLICLIIGLAILSIHVYKLSDPYYQEVLSLPGDPVKGEAMFQINCAGCHGIQANGNVGPSLKHVSKHKSKVEIIDQVISGKTPPMPKFQPTPQEMADLLSYLEQL